MVQFEEIAPGLWRLRLLIVNLYAVEDAGGWTMVDTGPPGFAGLVRRAAEAKFGGAPRAIVLTHAHFDHAGNAPALAEAWDVPVFCHELELPYITGQSDYPPQDPTLGGAMSFLERFFPHDGCDVGSRARSLPEDGTVPELPGWGWIATPGHTAGHVSFFREEDRALIVGDAFVTTNLDSWIDVVAWSKRIGPPVRSFTPDWPAAIASVRRLDDLRPTVAASGHGDPWGGEEFERALADLADEIAPPSRGRYVPEPAEYTNDGAVASVPPPAFDPLPLKLLATGAIALGAYAFFRRRSGKG